MNKKSWIIITVVVAFILGIGTFLYLRNTSSSSNKSNYEANKTSTDTSSIQTEEPPNNENQDNENQENVSPPEEKQEVDETENTPYTIEEQIATFSTKIYSKDSARQNNISITCKTLNGTIVKNGATFSFCSTVGPSSTSKGYQKADIFDKNGNKKKGLGGRKLPN